MTMNRMLQVLVVDDEDSFRLSLEMGLKLTNKFVVDSAESGESALAKMKVNQYDVILLDNRMPDIEGLEVVEWMNANKIHTPVVMVTGIGSEAVIVEAMKKGVYDYIRKDQIEIERLSLAIQGVYERYLYRRQLIEREAEERLLREKEKEMESLKMFHATVISVGQLVDRNLANLSKNLPKYEEELVHHLGASDQELGQSIFKEIKQCVDAAISGVNSISDLSSVILQKLEEIKGSLKQDDRRQKAL